MLRLGKQKKAFKPMLNFVEITVSRVKVRLLSYKVGLFASGLKRCLRILCKFLRSSVKELGYFKMVSSLRLRISRFLMQHAHHFQCATERQRRSIFVTPLPSTPVPVTPLLRSVARQYLVRPESGPKFGLPVPGSNLGPVPPHSAV